MNVPKEVQAIARVLHENGFEAYLVGGCLRDLIRNASPKDWDIATNAAPEQIQKLFPESVYENNFGTVGIKTAALLGEPRPEGRESEDPTLKIVEVTTYRVESAYTDKRHPDEVHFAKTITEDLSRRDFTVNAIAFNLDPAQQVMIDPFGGQIDLKAGLIRTVGDPEARFQEDALRLMRAVRFMAQLGFDIESATAAAIKKHASLLEFIAKERLRDELVKLIMTDKAAFGIEKLQEFGLLHYVVPELEEGVGMTQNKHHIYTVFEHNVKSLEYAAKNKFELDVRVSSLLHDVGKPRTKRGDGPDSTFYGHQVIGERLTLQILDRLHFPKALTEKAALLVREHMFVYDPETVTDAGARRLLRRVGKENIEDLFLLREADRIGSGVPKAQPYRLRHLKFRIEKVSKDPISAKMLKLNGEDLMKAGFTPGPRFGFILSILLEEVLDDPQLNDKDILMRRAETLWKLEERQLAEMARFARKSADQAQTRVEEEIKKKYFVQ